MFETVTNAIVGILDQADIPACVKYPETKIDRDSTLVCVSPVSGLLRSSGFGSYIGICDDGENVTELYGSRAEMKFSLELYSPAKPDFGAAGCIRLFDSIAALMGSCPEGIKLRSFEFGAAEFDTDSKMFRSKCTLDCSAYLLREAEPETGSFTDFILRGEPEQYEP